MGKGMIDQIRRLVEGLDDDLIFTTSELSALTSFPKVKAEYISAVLCKNLADGYGLVRFDIKDFVPGSMMRYYWLKIGKNGNPKIPINPPRGLSSEDGNGFAMAWYDLSHSVKRRGFAWPESITEAPRDKRVEVFRAYLESSGLPSATYDGRKVLVYHPKIAQENFRKENPFLRTGRV